MFVTGEVLVWQTNGIPQNAFIRNSAQHLQKYLFNDKYTKHVFVACSILRGEFYKTAYSIQKRIKPKFCKF